MENSLCSRCLKIVMGVRENGASSPVPVTRTIVSCTYTCILIASACYTQGFLKTNSDYICKINNRIRCYDIKKKLEHCAEH